MIKGTEKRERRLKRLKVPVRMTFKQAERREHKGQRPIMKFKRSKNFSKANPRSNRVLAKAKLIADMLKIFGLDISKI